MAIENLAQEVTGITIPHGCRAVLVSQGRDGGYEGQPVEMADSVLNIKRDLLKHLNEMPVSDEWLEQLRDYCDGRLAARSEARKGNGVVVPLPPSSPRFCPHPPLGTFNRAPTGQHPFARSGKNRQ